MLLAEIARTSRAVAATSARRAKIELLAQCLRDAGPADVAVAVAYLAGELPQRQIGVGHAALREAPAPAGEPSLAVSEVDAAFSEIGGLSGRGSITARRELLHGVLGRATREEQDFVVRLLSGELRQGALDGVMAEAVAAASQVPAVEVRRAAMLRGALPPVATAALAQGSAGLRGFGLEVGRPIKPMLAASAPSVEDAFHKLKAPDNPVAVEWKLDGIRAQIHIEGSAVSVFTRTLDDITDRLPEVVKALRDLPVRSAVFDGELIALRPDGHPHPFQVTSARTASHKDPGVPLSVFLFDALHLDGEDLLDRPGAERHRALSGVAPDELIMPRLVTASAAEATEVFTGAVARGHEGVVAKSLETPYTAGRRGAGWIKVKPRHTLDLVVLAVEWGHGRRRGKLSNLHLGARDPATGELVMLGKTFKGLTDKMLDWQTERLSELAVHSDAWTVHVRPELVVEVAFDGVQRSSRYPGGMALRFARVLRHRPDKSPAEADTVETVRTIAALPD
ncbi:MAG: ligase ATP-dependent Dnl1 [Streptosporangiaceae bacterium]|nr:ligase ATP-dependent Dnl1 [Streptosporangiaceae bacterium]